MSSLGLDFAESGGGGAAPLPPSSTVYTNHGNYDLKQAFFEWMVCYLSSPIKLFTRYSGDYAHKFLSSHAGKDTPII